MCVCVLVIRLWFPLDMVVVFDGPISAPYVVGLDTEQSEQFVHCLFWWVQHRDTVFVHPLDGDGFTGCIDKGVTDGCEYGFVMCISCGSDMAEFFWCISYLDECRVFASLCVQGALVLWCTVGIPDDEWEVQLSCGVEQLVEEGFCVWVCVFEQVVSMVGWEHGGGHPFLIRVA